LLFGSHLKLEVPSPISGGSSTRDSPLKSEEPQKLGRTIRNWFDKIANFHLARVTNGPTESLNNLIKRIKRIGFGFRNFENYRIRALLYAGKPNWRVLGSIVVR
jgi:transposase